MHANEREEIKEVRAGDIAAAVGLKDVTTGDTLTDIDTRSRSRRWSSRAGHLRRGRTKTKSDRRRWASPCSAWPRKIRLSGSAPTGVGQTIIAAWVSCTSTSSSTA